MQRKRRSSTSGFCGAALVLASLVLAGCGGQAGSQENQPESVSSPLGTVNVLTRNNDNQRTGANLAETVLTTANVNNSTFGKLFQLSVDDQTYAQPLYASGVSINGQTKNALYVATTNNTIYAFDAETAGAPALWSVNYNGSGRPVRMSDVSSTCRDINNPNGTSNIGIVGTPVIDGAAGTMFFVTQTVENASHVHRLHAVNIATGVDRVGSVVIAGSAQGVTFAAQQQLQRPALGLANGTVYIAFGSHCDIRPYHGWAMAYNATNLTQTGVFLTNTANGAAIWQSGGAPAFDSTGNAYYATGNSWTAEAHNGLGESIVKLAPQTLSQVAFYTAPSWSSLNDSDNDFGSAGPAFVTGTTRIFTGGKEGLGYLIDPSNMTSQTPFQAVNTTARPGNTHHLHSSSVSWLSPQGTNVYVWGENDFVRGYRYNTSNQTLATASFANGSQLAPMGSAGMPGGFMALSANGSVAGSGVLWTTAPTNNDANQNVVSGSFRAYNAETLALLWDSTGTANDMGNLAKYVPPVVANGRVYVASFSNYVSVYGLHAAAPPALPRTGWVVSASSSGAGDAPGNAIDGTASSRWSTGAAMANGQWFQADMLSAKTFSQITLDVGSSSNDYPRGYAVYVSNDGVSFGSSIAVGTGSGAITTVTFAQQTARYVRVVQTGSSSSWWSIAEFNVYGTGAVTPTALPRTGWSASASSSSGDVPANAIDGNASTRFSTGAAEANGQWFQVDMASAKTFTQITLDAGSSSGDYPRGYQVFISNDGSTWGTAIASGTGSTQLVTVSFAAKTARFIRVVLTGSAANWWSIHELNVYN